MIGKVAYEKKDRIAYVTLNRPDVLNALDDEMNREIWDIWGDFSRVRRYLDIQGDRA